jgi:hypothetical protein
MLANTCVGAGWIGKLKFVGILIGAPLAIVPAGCDWTWALSPARVC